jgi:hypothetical protein
VGNLSGRLLVNGRVATKRFIKRTAYVPQEDNFVPTMTTWEVMSFYAEVRGRGCPGEAQGFGFGWPAGAPPGQRIFCLVSPAGTAGVPPGIS